VPPWKDGKQGSTFDLGEPIQGEESMPPPLPIPRIEYLRVKNYRVLRDVEIKNLDPFSVLTGPNGSGKSTVFDVFAFLSESFNDGLRKAWDKRGRFRELRSRGSEGPIEIEVKYREAPKSPLITYHLTIDEDSKGPIVADEWLRWRRGVKGQPFDFLRFKNGVGDAIAGDQPDIDAQRVPSRLDSPSLLAVSALGQFELHPRVAALRRFISGWYLSYVSAASTRGVPDAGPQERLSATGENLANVIQYMVESRPDAFERVVSAMRARVPNLENIEATPLDDGRLMLRVKDAPFSQPVLSRFASDGTLKLLAYLTVLYDENRPQFIGIEEPENQLHPKLLYGLAEECAKASVRSQLLVTTHSPEFVEAVKPKQLWVVHRSTDGFARITCAADVPGISELMGEGANLGQLWREGYLQFGDPLRGATRD
jgi:predicted ATPase